MLQSSNNRKKLKAPNSWSKNRRKTSSLRVSLSNQKPWESSWRKNLLIHTTSIASTAKRIRQLMLSSGSVHSFVRVAPTCTECHTEETSIPTSRTSIRNSGTITSLDQYNSVETNHFSRSWKNTISTSCSSHKNTSKIASPGTGKSTWPLWTWPISMLPSHQKTGMNAPRWPRNNSEMQHSMLVKTSLFLEACSKKREVPQLSSLEQKLVFLRIRLKKNKLVLNSKDLSSRKWLLGNKMPTMAHQKNRLGHHKRSSPQITEKNEGA